MKIAFALAAGLAFTSPLAAAAPEPPPAPKLTFIHWWTAPSEAAAIGALVKLFNEKYPDVTVAPTVAPRAGNMRVFVTTIKQLQTEKHPPDAFQMYAGYGAQVFFDAGLLDPIDDLWSRDKLEEVIPSVIRDLCKFNGHYYSVPVNIHRTNVIWYNKALLEKNKIDPEALTSWDAFFAATQTLRASGVKNPIQVGVNWTQVSVLEGIVASQGMGTYQDWINGKMTTADDARLVKIFTIFGDYLSYANKDFNTPGHGWDGAVKRVMTGESAFCLMGDWADGEFRAAHMTYGKDYGALLVPGTKGMFGLGVDTFQHPRGIADETSSKRWLSLVASRAGQDAFNPLKGSIPARTDADITRYDAYQRAAIADLKAARSLYPTIGSAVPEVFRSRITGIVAQFSGEPNVDLAVGTMAAAAKNLAAAYTRTWALK